MAGSYEEMQASGGEEDHTNSTYEATTLPPNGLEGPIKIKKPRPPKPNPPTPIPPNQF